MISRFSRIHREFGFGASARIILLLLGLVGMSIFGIFGFDSWWPVAISVIGLVAGFLLRRQIVDAFEWFTWALPIAAVVYSILLFIGERLGLSRSAELILITLTTVVIFGIQFWSLSDPQIVKQTED